MSPNARGRKAFTARRVVGCILTEIVQCAWEASEVGTWGTARARPPLPAGRPRPAVLGLAGEV